MEDPDSATGKEDAHDDHATEPPDRLPLAEHPKGGGTRAGDSDEGKKEREDILLGRIKKGELLIIVLTGIVALSAVAQFFETRSNNQASSKQAEKLIAASQVNACAATKFATSAASISAGVAGAVTTLGKQAGDTQRFFQMDERPWVEIGSIKTTAFPPVPGTGTIFKFSIYPKNIGKTLARNLRIQLQDVGGGPELMSNKHGIKMYQDQLFHEAENPKKRIMDPDTPSPQTLAPGEQSIVPVYAGGTEPQRVPVYSGGTEPQRELYSYTLGKFSYIDAFGVPHWKHFCFFVLNSRGELANCQYGNDEDRNPEPAPNPN